MSLLLRGAGNAGVIPAVTTYDYDLWINLGQSNAQGTTENPWVTPPPTLAADTFFEWDGSTFVEKSGTPDRDTGAGYLGRYSGVGAGTAGYQSEFARQINLATGRKQLWLQYAVGGSGIVSGVTYGGGNWTDTHFPNAITEIDEAIAWLTSNGYTYRLRGVLWQQGEADSTAMNAGTVTAVTYQAALQAMVSTLHTNYAAIYDPMVGGIGAFFNIITNFGQYVNNATSRWPSLNVFRNYDIWDVQRRLLPQADSRVKPVCFQGPWLGLRGLLWDDVHASRLAYDQIGEVTALNLINGTGNALPAGPTSLAEVSRSNSNLRVSWTNNWTTPPSRRTLVERKLTSDPETAWEVVGNFTPSISTGYIGVPRRGVSYDIRLGAWGDDGIAYSNTLSVTIAAATVPADYFTASGVSGTQQTAIENLVTDIDGLGLLDDLATFLIFRTDYNANAGTTVYDVMRNADWSMTASGVTRNADHYATDGVAGDIWCPEFTNPWAAGGSKTLMLWHKHSSTDTGNLWYMGRVNGLDSASLIGGTAVTNFRYQTTSGTYVFSNSADAQGYQQTVQGITTSSAIADGTVRDVCLTHDPTDGRWRVYADGAGTPIVTGTQTKFAQMFNPEFGPRLARVQQTTFTIAKPSIAMLFNRNLSSAEYQAVRTAVNTHIV